MSLASVQVCVFGLVCVVIGIYIGWQSKPQTKEVAGSVRGPKGKFVKRSTE